MWLVSWPGDVGELDVLGVHEANVQDSTNLRLWCSRYNKRGGSPMGHRCRPCRSAWGSTGMWSTAGHNHCKVSWCL